DPGAGAVPGVRAHLLPPCCRERHGPHPGLDVRGRRPPGGHLVARPGPRQGAQRARRPVRRRGRRYPAAAPPVAAPSGRRGEVEGPGLMPAPAAVAQLAPRRIGSREFDFARRVAVMAIVNRTADSFYDDGRTYELQAAVQAALQAVAEGADWVDIGGMAFSPDAEEVSPAEELDRVLGVIEAVRAASDVVISVDTQRPEVARACVLAGADVVNDTTGLRVPGMAEVVAETGAAVVIAHSVAAPHRHLHRPQY